MGFSGSVPPISITPTGQTSVLDLVWNSSKAGMGCILRKAVTSATSDLYKEHKGFPLPFHVGTDASFD